MAGLGFFADTSGYDHVIPPSVETLSRSRGGKPGDALPEKCASSMPEALRVTSILGSPASPRECMSARQRSVSLFENPPDTLAEILTFSFATGDTALPASTSSSANEAMRMSAPS